MDYVILLKWFVLDVVSNKTESMKERITFGRMMILHPELKYPRIKRDEKLTVKIKSTDIPKIKEFYFRKGFTQSSLAKMFGVQRNTIRRILDPNFQKRINEWQRKYKNKKYRIDSEFRNKVIEQSIITVSRRKKEDPRYKDYTDRCNAFHRNKLK